MHEPAPPTLDQYGAEVHPAFGAIGASRVSCSPPGTVLFDSDIRHQHYVTVRLRRVSRRRDLHRDWLHPTEELFEVAMSEAQWASFVSSMNTGNGVPCTIRRTESEYDVPGVPYDPRLAHSTAEVKAAADEAFGKIRAAMAAVDALDPKAPAKVRREAMNRLRVAIKHSTGSVEFAGQSLVEHAEDVVQKARADVEAMVVQKAHQLGVAPEQIMSADAPAIEARR